MAADLDSEIDQFLRDNWLGNLHISQSHFPDISFTDVPQLNFGHNGYAIKQFDYHGSISNHDRDFSSSSNSTDYAAIFIAVAIVVFVMFILIYILSRCRRTKARECPPPPLYDPSQVVIISTTIPAAPPAEYRQNTITINPDNPMPQPQQPGYPTQQPVKEYPMPQAQPYAMPEPHDNNPPSYDQVVGGAEAYQTQAPFNPNYAGQ